MVNFSIVRVTAWLLVVACVPSWCGERADPWTCLKKRQMAKDERGEIRELTMAELQEIAVRRRMAVPLPSSVRAEACIVIEIVIGPDGKVDCARATNGHPLLRAAAVEAAKEWEFRPWIEKGRPMPVFGRLLLPASTSIHRDPCAVEPK